MGIARVGACMFRRTKHGTRPIAMATAAPCAACAAAAQSRSTRTVGKQTMVKRLFRHHESQSFYPSTASARSTHAMGDLGTAHDARTVGGMGRTRSRSRPPTGVATHRPGPRSCAPRHAPSPRSAIRFVGVRLWIVDVGSRYSFRGSPLGAYRRFSATIRLPHHVRARLTAMPCSHVDTCPAARRLHRTCLSRSLHDG